ncbi:pullulanase-type alpha-1,6-glucosidase [Actinomyces sp. MRS3W]|uniref:pullulanase-type alpha-1,6-glucosidase n=1 Tax=Actinomyces sp. MRS3W TaxID=2800796 RepID=UPI00396719FF
MRAVTTDATGNRTAASSLAVVGADYTGAEPPSKPDEPVDGLEVTIPGDHNTEMGCTSDWQPDCEQARLTQAASGLYTGTFDIPAGTWQYKAAIGGTWDENYGADGVPGGDNITYTAAGGPVTFYYDARTHQVWNDAEAPPVTLPGSFQDELGCESDWDPACLASIMRPTGDGTWTFSTEALPTGSYEVKVAVGLSWAENYGVDGAADGANYSFSATAGKSVVFTYDGATHRLTIEVADPPVAGTGEERAYWVDSTTLAWPVSLLPDGVTREKVVGSDGGTPAADAPITLGLVTAADGGAALSDGKVTGGTETPLRITGNLPEEVLAAHPNLDGYIAVSLTDADGKALLSDAEVVEALKGQVAVVQHGADGTGATAFTGVQTAAVIDSLYADAVADAPLGVTFSGGVPDFALWAPTAQEVTLLTWDTGSPTGSAALVDGDPVRTPAVRGDDGRWTVAGADAGITAGSQYLWEVKVYAPSTGAVETNLVTDPYSVGLTLGSVRSVAVNLSDPALAPEQWATTASPVVASDAGRTIYELHVRDFSAADATVPEEYRGTYKAFTVTDSDGMKHLAELADAGIDTIHLLPTFDIATIEEDRAAQQVPDIPAAAADSTEQQAAISAVKDADAYNWGYDPYHYTTPEGSYATTGNQDGGARSVEFRQMVGALHATGLQVVLDQVFNHTAASGQDAKSVLDRVVPGYYQRLDDKGNVLTSTCCSNTATENALAERLMIDSVVTWARDYHVDGFRFDLMGYHSVDTMTKLRAALNELTLEKDGVDGSAIYLYGEGWNMGEIADNALFTTATQGQLDGTCIGTFNDRLRDAVHGGGPFDDDPRVYQGFGTGLYTAPNGLSTKTEEEQLADLGHLTDLVKLGMAGNLKDYSFTTSDGTVKKGGEIDYNGQAAGYASSPEETINYVDAHDNETLFDLGVFKLAAGTSMADRVRMNSLSLATVTLGQSPSFWASGTEMLRSKSLDRDSYNSGDYFNAIDWTGQDNGFGAGLPMESSNGSKWDIMAPLLADSSLKPTADDIATSNAQMLDFLRIRTSTPLFHLGSADAIQAKLTFPNSGTGATPGVIAMLIDDPACKDCQDVDSSLAGVLVVFNASGEEISETMTDLSGREFVLHEVQAGGSDDVVKGASFDAGTGTATVPARTVAVYVEKQEGGSTEPTVEPSDEPTAEPTGEPTAEPTGEPTSEPTATTEPTADPSTEPSGEPSASAEPVPTTAPTTVPSGGPSAAPAPSTDSSAGGSTAGATSAVTASPSATATGTNGTGPLARTGASTMLTVLGLMAVALVVAGVMLRRRRRA